MTTVVQISVKCRDPKTTMLMPFILLVYSMYWTMVSRHAKQMQYIFTYFIQNRLLWHSEEHSKPELESGS